MERSLSRARWAGGAVALLQAALTDPAPYKRPYIMYATAAVGAVLLAGNVALVPFLRRREVPNRLAVSMFGLDVAAICFLVWLYLDNPNSTLWALFTLVPLEAAYRWQMPAAVSGAAGCSAYYGAVRYVAGSRFGFDVALNEMTYVAGLLLVEALAVGGMAQRLLHERDALQKLHDSSLALNSRLEPKPILHTVAREAARVLEADFAVLWVAEDRAFVPASSYGLPPGLAADLRLPFSDPVFGEAAATAAYRTRAPTWHAGTRSERGRALESMILPREWRSVVSVPVVHEDETLGVLSCYLRAQHRFEPDEIARLEALAALAAVAITNASAYERERLALEALKEVDALKDDFLSTISHELRTPLTAVEGFAATLLRRWDEIQEAGKRDFVGRIERQARALHALIADLLDFSQLQSGSYAFRPQTLRIRATVQDILHRLESSLEPHPVTVEVPADLECTGDELAFERVLENLLINAARYSPRESEIVVRAEPSGDWVRISVADEGLGIPAEDVSRVFQRFYRGQSDDVRRVRGTGVGLAVVKELVEGQGGEVWVESGGHDGGSTFFFRLPCAPVPKDVRRPSSARP